LLSFLTIAGITGGANTAWLEGLKLDLAAVEATDWAIDGTVNIARREEGRPDFTGTVLGATGAGTGMAALEGVEFTGALDGSSATATGGVAGVVLDPAFFTGMGEATAFLGATGLATTGRAFALAGLVGLAGGAFAATFAFTSVFTGAAAGFFATGAGLAVTFAGALAAGLALLGATATGAALDFAAATGLALALLGLALMAFTA
jgi:hypothetical protein